MRESLKNTFNIGPQDMANKREFESHGLKFKFEAHDPYGMITGDCITTKTSLDGTFTSYKAAEAAAIKYAVNYKKDK